MGLPGVSGTGNSFHQHYQTERWVHCVVAAAVQLTSLIIFYQKRGKKMCSHPIKIHVVLISSILQTRKEMFKFPRENFEGC